MHALRLLAIFFALCSTLTASEMTITQWAVWGPGWGRAGFSALSPGMEKRMNPHPGDIGYSWGIDRSTFYVWRSIECTDGMIDLYSEKVLPFAPAISNDAGIKWAGQTAYANSYLFAPEDRNVELIVEASQTADIFFNGDVFVWKRSPVPVMLKTGWNRLLVKTLSPSSIRGGLTPVFPKDGQPGNWTLRVQIRSTAPSGLEGILSSSFDPSRGTNASFARYETSIVGQNNERPLFVRNKPVSLSLRITAASGIASNIAVGEGKRFRGTPWVYSQPLHQQQDMALERLQSSVARRIFVRFYDIDGRMMFDKNIAVSYEIRSNAMEAVIPLFSGVLPTGHYALTTDFLNADGSIQTRGNEHAVAVVWGPVNTNGDTAPRVLGAVGHWLAEYKPVDNGLERLSWLSTVGVLRHLKVSQAWKTWGVTHDGMGNAHVGEAPAIDALIARARKLGIRISGDLSFGYITSDPKRRGQDMALTEDDADAVQRRATMESAAKGIVLQPYGAAALPPYGTPEFEKTLYAYAHSLVSKYRDRVHTWGGDNEIDLHAGSATPAIAAVYAHASRILYRAMKDADPSAQFITASLVRDTPFISNLFLFGYGANADLIDVHAHPYRSPLLSDTLIGNSPKEGQGAIVNYARGANDKPVIYGEFSSPISHSVNGAFGQAEGVVKQIAWALKQPNIRAMHYLVPYSGEACLGFCNINNDPLPANNAVNVVSHLLDGRRVLTDVPGIGEKVQQIRTDGADGLNTIALWVEEPAMEIVIPCRSESISIIDMYGRETRRAANGGSVRVSISSTPLFVRGIFQ